MRIKMKWLYIVLILIFSIYKTSQAQNERGNLGGVSVSLDAGLSVFSLNKYQTTGDETPRFLANSFRLGIDYSTNSTWASGICLFWNGFQVGEEKQYRGENGGIGAYGTLEFFKQAFTAVYATGGAGYTGLVFENYREKGKASTNGYYLTAGLGRKVYLGNRLVFFYQLSYSFYHHFKLDYKSNVEPDFIYSNWSMKMQGIEMKAGIAFSFRNEAH